jgi:hypothetical protein
MEKSRCTERRGPREIITGASGSGPRVAGETSSHQADFFHQFYDNLWRRLDRFEKILTTFTGFRVLNAICREQVARNATCTSSGVRQLGLDSGNSSNAPNMSQAVAAWTFPFLSLGLPQL